MKKFKFNYEIVKKYFEDQGCKLLESEYVHIKHKMKYKCSCGNISEINFDNFKRGKRCKKCGKCQKHSFDFVKQCFEDQKCKLLETEYKNISFLMSYECFCGNVDTIAFKDLKRGIKCKECSRKKMSKLYAFDFNYVKDFFKQQGCQLLETEYINARIPLRYKCSCGNESKICFYSFKAGIEQFK
jgi:hypothetical protein